MRYQLDSNTPFRHSGNILNCANDEILNPLNFSITSYFINIKTRESSAVTVTKNAELVAFDVPADTLDAGTYEWRVYLNNNQVSWTAPTVLVEVR